MAEGGAPPAEAVRGGMSTAVAAVAIIVVAIIAFVAGGFVLGPVFTPTPGRPDVFTIATNTPFPPFMFLNETDVISGHDIDLITEVMKRLNLSFEFVDFRDFSLLLAAVGEGRVDIAASAITSSGTTGAERNETMDFSDVYFESDQGVLTLDGQDPVTCAASGCVPADFTGLSIATQSGTTSEFWVLDFVTEASPAIAGASLTTFVDVTQVLLALEFGTVDVVVIDKPAGEGIEAANPTVYDVVGTIETNELYAFAVPEGDPFDLLPDINEALATIFADGTYTTIFDRYFKP